jgi:hypothetical protein
MCRGGSRQGSRHGHSALFIPPRPARPSHADTEGNTLRESLPVWARGCAAALEEYGRWLRDEVLPTLGGEDDGLGAAVGREMYSVYIREGCVLLGTSRVPAT